MSVAPKVTRQIGGQHWEAGINNIIFRGMDNQIISWHETGWVYSMHLLSANFDLSGNRIINVRQDVYKLDVYPPNMGNILNYIISENSNKFKKSSRICRYVR